MIQNTNEVVLTEEREGILIVTINRPAVRNAMNAEVAQGIGKALERLDAEDSLRVGILTGGGGYFCSGMDLGEFAKGGPKPRYADRGFAGIVRKPPKKPIVAAVEGVAVAGGFEIAIACDIIVSAEQAKFGLPEVKRGLVAAAGALIRLPRRMPYHIVMEMALTGEYILAERLHHFGIVNTLVKSGGALQEALAIAQRIISGGPVAVAATKRILVEQQDWTLDDMWDKQAEHYVPAVSTQDAIEGAVAFKERRPPRWQGR